MKTENKGFTLIELVVVVLIMGILSSMGVPYYYKTIETSRATDSVAIGHLLGNANRMYQLDRPAAEWVSGQITNTCNGYTTCTQTTPPAGSACRLVACGYVAQQDWNNASYDFFVCNGAAGGGFCATSGTERGVASVRRKSGAPTDYSGWGYAFYSSGRCEKKSTAPDCPKF
jgi:prepilin-type N-terminal cleavage/methylation domain-containing protein